MVKLVTPLALRPVVSGGQAAIVAYEVDRLPDGHRAGIVQTDRGDWQVVWSIGNEHRDLRGDYRTAAAALAALTHEVQLRLHTEE